MNPEATSKLLKSIGLSSNVILALTALGVGFYIYRNYYETVKLKYQIEALKEGTTQDPRLFT